MQYDIAERMKVLAIHRLIHSKNDSLNSVIAATFSAVIDHFIQGAIAHCMDHPMRSHGLLQWSRNRCACTSEQSQLLRAVAHLTELRRRFGIAPPHDLGASLL